MGSDRSRKRPGFVGRTIAALIMLGVLLGAYRWLGQGANVWEPDFFPNAEERISRLFDWSDDTIRDKTRQEPPNTPDTRHNNRKQGGHR